MQFESLSSMMYVRYFSSYLTVSEQHEPCQITILLEVNHQGVELACLAQQPNTPNWIVVDCMVSTLGDCSTTSSINLLNTTLMSLVA